MYVTCSSNDGSPPEDLEACPPAEVGPAPPLLPPLLSLLSARQIGVRRRYVFPFALWEKLDNNIVYFKVIIMCMHMSL